MTITDRLRSLEARIIRQGPEWDFTHVPADDVAFIRACGQMGDIQAIGETDMSRLERILLVAGRVEGTA